MPTLAGETGDASGGAQQLLGQRLPEQNGRRVWSELLWD